MSRAKALSEVVGYLVLENGIFLFGLTLLTRMPVVVEMGILLDVFVGVFVMGIVLNAIGIVILALVVISVILATIMGHNPLTQLIHAV